MQAFYCDHFVLPLPPGHRFPMAKYRLLRERVAATAPGSGVRLCEPSPADWGHLERVHTPAYVEAVRLGTLGADLVRRIGFPWSPAMVERSRRSVGGTLAAARAAMVDGAAVNLAGGTHHAFRDRGEGYCVFNDVAVAASVLLDEGVVRRILVVDLDVHQGNGTARIFAGDDRVFTLSVHGEKNYPFRKERSDLDVGLVDGTRDDEYLQAVERTLEIALARHAPDLVCYVAGADPYEGDRLGRLAVTMRGLRRRDELVLDATWDRGVPVAIVMGGGYASDVETIVAIHAATVDEAARRHRGDRPDAPALPQEDRPRLVR